ncbi:PREDICTED: coiled-coil domain-containing protein KIAA1407 homolog [Elephantulus edwardii]|uniref:coiled-coil domain-containing protein KIAA1407 homolog n=1 Tax=Elephantulus edwardii TaxID=28737 RepID=UPI0003F07721|nr:PREDICTED: coiled-coil domain-containing protein KIAA1407 homolog [Elephantulus edwardii]
MQLAPQEKSASGKRTRLNGWKRFTRKPSPKIAFDPDNVEQWMKKVERASELAVSEAFSLGNSALTRKLWGQEVDLEASERMKDHDDAYTEGKEILFLFLLQYLYGYLEEEEESTTVQKFIDHLLQKDVVDSGMLEELGKKENQDKKQQKDPRLTMEMRHKQVKENRLRREKELERQRMEKALKKSAFLEAQCLVQEEKKRKALVAKKEEEEIQKEMVKLRREIIERRRTVAEAWKTEKKKQEENYQKKPGTDLFGSAQLPLEEEKMAKERKKKLKELLIQISKDNYQCQRRYFSAWHQLILDDRIKLGKAGTLSDWKFQLKVLRAWRDYTRSQKLKRETQAVENDLREENRKQQVATEYNRKQVLRHCFAEWQHWHRVEIQKRALALTKEETRRKMDVLLKAASLGKLTANESSHRSGLLEKAATSLDPSGRSGEGTAVPSLWGKPPVHTLPQERSPKSTLQGPLQNVPLNTPDNQECRTVDNEPSFQKASGNEKLRVTSQKTEPMCIGHFHNRHVFQQQLIEKQKKKLQEQEKIILELKENQRLAEARWTAKSASAATDARSHQLSNVSEEEPRRVCQTLLNSPAAASRTEDKRSDSQNSLSRPRRNTRQLMAPHPILKAMEERAIQRAERRRILAERKKKQEEEKLAQLKAQEEERQKREVEEKIAQLERRREEKRLKKMKELEKQKRIERNRQLEAIAKEHYERVLLRKKGLEPWKRMRLQNIQNIQVAKEHHSSALQRKCLLAWVQCTQENLTRRAAQADQVYAHNLLQRVIRGWLQYLTDLEKKARKFYEHFLQKKLFRAWLNTVREAKIDFQSKYKIAEEHSNRRISRAIFQTWKQSARLLKEERLREERRDQLRRKVAEILPDFQMLAPP